MRGAARVAVVTHNLESAGGTRTLASFLCRVLAESPRFMLSPPSHSQGSAAWGCFARARR